MIAETRLSEDVIPGEEDGLALYVDRWVNYKRIKQSSKASRFFQSYFFDFKSFAIKIELRYVELCIQAIPSVLINFMFISLRERLKELKAQFEC